MITDELKVFFIDHPDYFTIFGTALGLFVGSFLNVVIYRLPVMMQREWLAGVYQLLKEHLIDKRETGFPWLDKGCSECGHTLTAEGLGQDPATLTQANLAWPPSACPHCGHKITALENIPVISYLFLRGKCKGCSAPISKQYPLVELLSGLLSGIIAYHYGWSLATLAALFLTWALLSASVIDYHHYLLPDHITMPFLWLGLICALLGVFPDVTLHDAVIGALFGYLSLWSVYWLFKLLTGKEGMGYGDFKLLALLGAWMGWQMIPLILLLSAVVGSVVGIVLILLKGRDTQKPIPFGPYLAGAGWLAFLWGNDITAWYWQLFPNL